MASATATEDNVRVMNARLRKEKRRQSQQPPVNSLLYVKIREGLGHSLPVQHGRKKCRSCSCVNSLISFGFLGASLERQLPKLRRKGYCCQCITHFGCCIKRKPRENIQVCVNVLPTSYRQVTNTLPTVGRQVFWGALLHNYHNIQRGQISNRLYPRHQDPLQAHRNLPIHAFHLLSPSGCKARFYQR